MELWKVAYLFACLPVVLGQTIEKDGTEKRESNGMGILISLVGIILVCMEILIYVRDFRLKNVINFALFKSELGTGTDHKFSNEPDSETQKDKIQ